MQYRGLGMKFNLLFVLFNFLAHRFLPKYDVRMQLLMFQIRMLRNRIDDQCIVPTPEEQADLLRLGNEINHNVAGVMLVVKPQAYRRWLSSKAKTRTPKPVGRPGTADEIVALILRMATENLSWGYKRIFGELKKLGFAVGLTTIRDSLLENLVFTALRRVTPEIFYYRTKAGREVDLVALLPSVPGQERTILLVQACASLADPRVK